ncbi:hypothetical protein E3V08_05930 [Candidatus Atribacteria bacterium MT.SAG.1]|nr:hypothetical protein E3V08_05930 [Candidatus Atribacteria bacterium MT.SAG.1]
MAQELIPKEKIKISSIVNTLFLLSLMLLIILGGSYVFLRFKNYSTQSGIKNANNQIIEIKAEKDNNTERYVFNAQKKIKDFSEILEKHKITSNFFTFIDKISYEKVKFLELSLNTKTKNVSLRGETENFDTLGKQILSLKKSDFVKGLNISNISLNKEGQVSFTVNFSLDSKIF